MSLVVVYSISEFMTSSVEPLPTPQQSSMRSAICLMTFHLKASWLTCHPGHSVNHHPNDIHKRQIHMHWMMCQAKKLWESRPHHPKRNVRYVGLS